MKILMNKTERGSEDGVRINIYQKGVAYEVSDELAKAFIDDLDWAEEAPEDVDAELPERDPGDVRPGEAIAETEDDSEVTEKTIETDIENEDRKDHEILIDVPKETGIETGIETPETKKAASDAEDTKDVDVSQLAAGALPEGYLLSSGDDPYKNEAAAKTMIKRRGLLESHEPVVIQGGYALKPIAIETPEKNGDGNTEAGAEDPTKDGGAETSAGADTPPERTWGDGEK